MTASLRGLCRAAVLLAALCLGTTDSDAAVSVRDFGAKGDGRTDDTEAIRAAFAASVKLRRGGRYGKHGMYYNTFPVVVFPSGKYVISDTIEVPVKTVRGEGTPSILQRTEGKDIFHYPSSWHGTIEGLTFLGGHTQLSLGNRNLDKGHFVIEKCKFYHGTGPAILFREGSNSTFLIVRDCIIAGCIPVHSGATIHQLPWRPRMAASWTSVGGRAGTHPLWAALSEVSSDPQQPVKEVLSCCDGVLSPISALRNLDEWPHSPAISRLDLGLNPSVSRRTTSLTGC